MAEVLRWLASLLGQIIVVSRSLGTVNKRRRRRIYSYSTILSPSQLVGLFGRSIENSSFFATVDSSNLGFWV